MYFSELTFCQAAEEIETTTTTEAAEEEMDPTFFSGIITYEGDLNCKAGLETCDDILTRPEFSCCTTWEELSCDESDRFNKHVLVKSLCSEQCASFGNLFTLFAIASCNLNKIM